MSTTPVAVPVSKNEFQGDVLDREFKIIRNDKGEYFYDYVEKTPEVESALQSIKYLRLKGPLAAVKTAMEARSAMSSPTKKGTGNAGMNLGTGGPSPNGKTGLNSGTGGPSANGKTGLNSGTGGPSANGKTGLNSGTGGPNTAGSPISGNENKNNNTSSTNGISNNSRSRASSLAGTEEEEETNATVSLGDYCTAVDSLKNPKINEKNKAKFEATKAAYLAGGKDAPDCDDPETRSVTVSPPPLPSSALDGGKRRKTKKTKKSKRKTRKHTRKH